MADAETRVSVNVKRVMNDYEEEEDGKPKKIPRTLVEKTTERRLIVILENASLETVKVSQEPWCWQCVDFILWVSASDAGGNFSNSSNTYIIISTSLYTPFSLQVGRKFELLNCDDHKKELSKHSRDISLARPDIAHQCLMMLLDSPLNRTGLLQVYIHTTKNVLIEINPHLRVPRTFNRFCGLMGKSSCVQVAVSVAQQILMCISFSCSSTIAQVKYPCF